MAEQWLFVAGTRLHERFQEQLLVQAHATGVERVVKEKLRDIQQQPVTPNPVTFNGEPMHFVKTGRFVDGEVTIPKLLIVYYLDHVRYFIHLVHICDAADVTIGNTPSPSEADQPVVQLREYRDRAAPEPIERMLRRVFAQTLRGESH